MISGFFAVLSRAAASATAARSGRGRGIVQTPLLKEHLRIVEGQFLRVLRQGR